MSTWDMIVSEVCVLGSHTVMSLTCESPGWTIPQLAFTRGQWKAQTSSAHTTGSDAVGRASAVVLEDLMD